ncbi:hypothetical protein [Streptomyces sp. NRRL F-4428]|uniref:hypothetical protein n=1 Tax=Streptomyces sp. NRRL F-4428 TaxID=1609137 RepID=UPI0005ECB86C|nr:hypothetical protein [Streptomyces sp. NRRL F-4428]KJK45308.1 hypothetical protein UK14_26410 [Streptomyces sp. NRRL F-4428]
MRRRSKEAAAGLSRIEGYLMSQAALQEARAHGEAFAAALTWLGPAEQDEISRRFAQHHLGLRKKMLAETVARAGELEAEYSRRYALLRRRITGLLVAVLGLYSVTLLLR